MGMGIYMGCFLSNSSIHGANIRRLADCSLLLLLLPQKMISISNPSRVLLSSHLLSSYPPSNYKNLNKEPTLCSVLLSISGRPPGLSFSPGKISHSRLSKEKLFFLITTLFSGHNLIQIRNEIGIFAITVRIRTAALKKKML